VGAAMKNARLFVRSHRFRDDSFQCYWSQSSHAWGCLSSATVYTLDEVKSFERTAGQENHATVMCRLRKTRWFVPTEGEFEELPDTLKLKTVEEWLEDIA
jgi:phage terminase large subunit GpA-like protein